MGSNMPQSVAKLVEGQQLMCVSRIMTVREAIKCMVENDYSQLPVVDAKNAVAGLFTERKMMTLADMGALTKALDRPVLEFLEHPHTVDIDQSIYEVARMLGGNDMVAVLVMEGSKLRGIVTDYDIAEFLASWSEGIALLEDIEKRLRAAIKQVFPTPESRAAAIYRAIGKDKANPTLPAKEYDELTLHEHEQLITYEQHWRKFEPLLQNKDLFVTFMACAKPIRNKVAHFRGDLTVGELKQLREVAGWLIRRQVAWTIDAKELQALMEEAEAMLGVPITFNPEL